jgi:hypothetical protein
MPASLLLREAKRRGFLQDRILQKEFAWLRARSHLLGVTAETRLTKNIRIDDVDRCAGGIGKNLVENVGEL